MSHAAAAAALCALLLVATPLVSAKEYECKDLHTECPQWRKNMNGNCKGVDYQYMLHNCPKTCEMCDEAKEKWEKEEAEKRKNPTYEPDDSKVIVLDAETIEEFLETKGEDHLILIEFYAPWCGHCQHVAPEFRKAAAELHALSTAGTLPIPVVLAKFDDSDPKNQGYRAGSEQMFNFTSYPSLYIVNEDKFPLETRNKHFYNAGKDNAANIVYHMSAISNGKTQKEAWYGYLDVEKGTKPGMYKKGGKHETEHLVELDLDNFAEQVLQSDAVWIVEYYSDKCPICNTMAPHYIEGAKVAQAEFPDGRLKYGAVNSRVFMSELGAPYGVKSYPWVTSFYLGENRGHMAGMGGADSFTKWGKKILEENFKEGTPGKKDMQLPKPVIDEDEEADRKEIEAEKSKDKEEL